MGFLIMGFEILFSFLSKTDLKEDNVNLGEKFRIFYSRLYWDPI